MKNAVIFTFLILLALVAFSPMSVSAITYNLYVDDSNDTGIEDGTAANPYNTIAEAITAAEGNSAANRKIYVYNGQYREQLYLTASVSLYGQSKDNTIILGRSAGNVNFSYAVKMGNGTVLKNFKVSYGSTGVLVNEDSKATIDSCKIEGFASVGVNVGAADAKDSKIFTLQYSEIYNGENKAAYIRKRKVYIYDNDIHDNDGEGLDFRSAVKGTVKSNNIYDNEEAGIEIEVRSSGLKLSGNKIKSNDASGITLQYRNTNRKGDITIKSNTIKKNHDYGIKCGSPNGGNVPKTYFKKSTELSKNKITSNKDGKYSKMCKF